MTVETQYQIFHVTILTLCSPPPIVLRHRRQRHQLSQRRQRQTQKKKKKKQQRLSEKIQKTLMIIRKMEVDILYDY